MEPTITIRPATDFAVDAALLSPGERAVMPAAGRRRDEWIRGRLAMRAALVATLGSEATAIEIVIAPDAGPLLVGGPPCAISLSHDPGWIAVAVAVGACRVGIDLCVRSHATRIGGLLRWLDVRHDCDPVAAWAALEAVLKLRRWPVMRLRDHKLSVLVRDEVTVVVSGLGTPATVTLRMGTDYVAGWATEMSTEMSATLPTTMPTEMPIGEESA